MIRWIMAAACIVALTPANAEDAGGMRADVTLAIGGAWDRDPNLSGKRSSAGHAAAALHFGISSKTRTQSLKFNLSGDWVDRIGPHTEARLTYSRRNKSSSLAFHAGYKRLPAGAVDYDAAFDGPSRGFDLSTTGSSLRIADAGVRVITGLGRPIGFDVSYGINRRRTIGPSAGRTTRGRFQSEMKIRMTSRTHSRVFWDIENLNATGTTRLSQDQRVVGFAMRHNISRGVAFDLDLGHQRLDTVRNGTTTRRAGFKWGIGIEHVRKDGLVYARATSEQAEQGTLKRLQFGIQRKLPTQSLELVVGAARLAQHPTKPTVSLSYRADHGFGRVWAIAAHDFAASDETGETRIASKLDLGAARHIGRHGTLNLSLGVIRTSATGLMPRRDARRLKATYRHELKRDWGLVLGAQRRIRRDAAKGRLGSNSVFLTFEHKFSGGL